MGNEKMREAFEKWCREGTLFTDWSKRPDGQYQRLHVQDAWLSWQAATAATQRDAMAVAEAVRIALIESFNAAYLACDSDLCEHKTSDGLRAMGVNLAAIVEAVQPGKREAVNQQLLRCIEQVDACMDVTQVEPEDNAAWLIVKAAAEAAQPACAEPVAWAGFHVMDANADKQGNWPSNYIRHRVFSDGPCKPKYGQEWVPLFAQQPASAQQQGEPVAYITNDGCQLIFADRAEEFSTRADMRPLIYGDTASAGSALDAWCSIESAPKDGRTILLGYFNSHGNWRTLRGQWFTKEHIEDNWEDGDLFDAGWYETSVEADDVPSCWPTRPTHWMPTPAAPKPEGILDDK